MSKQIGAFSIGADYSRVRIKNDIASKPQAIIDLERDNKLPLGAVVERDSHGHLRSVTVPSLNNAESEVDTAHWHATSNRDINYVNVAFRLAGSHILNREWRIAGTNQDQAFPKSRISATLTASRGNLSMNWAVKAVSGFNNSERSAKYDSWVGHDLTFEMHDVFGYKNAKLRAGILNVTDEDPSTDPTNPFYEGITGWHLVWGRGISVTCGVDF